MAFVTAGGLTVHYELRGPEGAPVLVLLNSLGTNFHLWDLQIEALARTHRVLRYDMRGHGLSSFTPPGEADSIANLADDLAHLLDVLGLGAATLVGLSIGGMVAQRFAAAYPDRTEAIVLCATGSQIGPPSSWDDRIALIERGGMDAILDGVMARWFTAATHAARPAVVDGFRMMVGRTPVAGYAGGCRAVRDADLRADDARIRVPALVISGSDDPATPPAGGRALCAAIPGAQYVEIAGAAHILNVDQPDAFAVALETFLSARRTVGGRA
jgi:3-oxoadipate enol-lactonase